jgi:hypothetical protein
MDRNNQEGGEKQINRVPIGVHRTKEKYYYLYHIMYETVVTGLVSSKSPHAVTRRQLSVTYCIFSQGSTCSAAV